MFGDTSSSTDPRSRARRSWVIALTCGLIVVLIGGGFLAYKNYSAASGVAVTPTVISSDLQKDEVNMLLGLDQTMLYQTVMEKRPVWQDPLDGSHAQAWDLYQQNGIGCQFAGQALHVFVSDQAPVSAATCLLRNEFLTNFAFQIQETLGSQINANELRLSGIIFRANSVHQDGYSCDVYTNSYKGFSESQVLLSLTLPDSSYQPLQSSSNALPDNMNAPHILTLIVLHNTINIYIDGQPIVDVTNGTFQSGQLGVFASITTTSATFSQFDDLFQNAKLWTFQ